jgi:hypothetical protein
MVWLYRSPIPVGGGGRGYFTHSALRGGGGGQHPECFKSSQKPGRNNSKWRILHPRGIIRTSTLGKKIKIANQKFNIDDENILMRVYLSVRKPFLVSKGKFNQGGGMKLDRA